MNTCIETSKEINSPIQQLNETSLHYHKQLNLLQGVVECLIDGILILTDQGEVIHANSCANRLCQQLTQNQTQVGLVPQKIWNVCQALVKNRGLFPDQSVILEDELGTDQPTTVRVRVQWIDLHTTQRSYLLVTLEDRAQSARKMAIAEIQKYSLSPRESEVWLLRRANRTYKQIASELYIAVDTVKKHIRNIHAKRQAVLDQQN